MATKQNDDLLSNTTIFLHTYEFVTKVFKLTGNFRRPLRYVLGDKIDHLFLDFLVKLNDVMQIPVNRKNHPQRLLMFEALSKDLDRGRLLLRFACEFKIISAKLRDNMFESAAVVGRELGGLIKFTKAQLST